MSQAADTTTKMQSFKPPLIPGYFKVFVVLLAVVSAALGFVLWSKTRAPQSGGNFTLNHEGQLWTLADHSKKLNLLYVGYAKCPDVCPMSLSYTATAFKKLSERELAKVQLVFISVDADNDTAENVSVYAKQFFKEFIGLTGTREQIDLAIKPFGASYVVEKDQKSYLGYSIAHTDRLFFLDKKGYVIDSIPNPRDADMILEKIKEHL